MGTIHNTRTHTQKHTHTFLLHVSSRSLFGMYDGIQIYRSLLQGLSRSLCRYAGLSCRSCRGLFAQGSESVQICRSFLHVSPRSLCTRYQSIQIYLSLSQCLLRSPRTRYESIQIDRSFLLRLITVSLRKMLEFTDLQVSFAGLVAVSLHRMREYIDVLISILEFTGLLVSLQRLGTVSVLKVQTIALQVSLNLNLHSQSHWSLCNGTRQS